MPSQEISYQTITSKDNDLIKKVLKLITNKSYRQEQRLAIVYGQHAIIEAQRYGILHSILVRQGVNLNQILPQHILPMLSDCRIKKYLLSQSVMQKVNILDGMSDIIGVIKLPQSDNINKFYTADCLVLDNIQDTGNLGTILRTAAATGFHHIVLSTNSVDVYNPKVIRASQGMQFGLNVITVANLEGFFVKYQGVIVLTTPHTDRLLYNTQLVEQPVALVFGNEGSGLSQQVINSTVNTAVNNLSRQRLVVKIPMHGEAESLNVAMAATVCMFEVLRQRGFLCG